MEAKELKFLKTIKLVVYRAEAKPRIFAEENI